MLQPNERQHHTIWTPELVEISLPLAGVARRCVAMLVDQILMGVLITGLIFFLLFAMGVFAGFMSSRLDMETEIVLYVVLGLMLVFLSLGSYITYFWAFHTFNNGQTIGKKMLGIRVVTDRGGRASAWTCFVRALFDLLDMLLFYGGISVMMIIMTEREKRIADFAAGTIVILDR